MTTSFIERKINCSKEFVEILAQRLKERLFKVVLFGSVAKGSGNADSDIDLLVVVDQITNDIRKAVAETAFEASIRSGEPIEYIVMSLDEYRTKSLDNPFIYEVESYGKVLYCNPKPEERMIQKLMELAEEYYSYALKCIQQLMYRPAIDMGQNAIELVLKALILTKGEVLPRSHGGYIHKFGEAYVIQGEISRDIIPKLYKALEMRNKARYDPEYRPTETDVNEVIQTYKELKEIAHKFLVRKEK
jgi:uncharacterized protein (UPF0332 family)/predicted nucleotidyltransferase